MRGTALSTCRRVRCWCIAPIGRFVVAKVITAERIATVIRNDMLTRRWECLDEASFDDFANSIGAWTRRGQ